MDLSRGLVTKIVDEGKIKEVNRSGITQDFIEEDSLGVFQYIQRHFAEYKSIPSRDAVLKAYPNYSFAEYKEPLEYFINTLKESFRRKVLDEFFYDVAPNYQKNTKTAEEKLRETLSELAVTGRTYRDINLAIAALDRIELYEKKKESPGADGILTNWRVVDNLTLGWHEEDFVVLVGDKYIGKSWLMLWMAYQAMLQGERVLFVTKEMSQKALANRFDSMYANVKFDSLRRGELSGIEESRYRDRLKEFSGSGHHFIMARHSSHTIKEIEQKAVETDATVVFIDSVYLFPVDSKSVYVSETAKRKEISSACKDSSRTLGIPWVVSTQARRKQSKKFEPDLDDIEYSNAFAQDADAVLQIVKDEVDRELGRLQLHVLKSRDGDIGSIYIRTDFDYMTFEQDQNKVGPTTDIVIKDNENFEESESWN